MNQNRQPKGIPTGGRFAGNLHAESNPMEAQTGEFARSTATDLLPDEAKALWADAKRAHDQEPEAGEGLKAGRNLTRNPCTPPEVLHSMLVKRDDDGNQITRAWFMDKPVAIRDALEAVIKHPNTSAETLYVIARSSGHQPQSEAAKRRLKAMRAGATSLRERVELFSAWRNARRKVTPGK